MLRLLHLPQVNEHEHSSNIVADGPPDYRQDPQDSDQQVDTGPVLLRGRYPC